MFPSFEPFEQRIIAELGLVPPDVGQRQIERRRIGADPSRGPGQEPQTGDPRRAFVGSLREQLHAEADPEHREVGIAKERHEAPCLELTHRVLCGAHAWQDHGLHALDLRRRRGTSPRYGQAFERELHAAQVAGPVVDQGDHRIPLVDGTWSSQRGSSSMAARRALPSPLKIASIR